MNKHPEEHREHLPYLVQRMEARTGAPSDKKGVDALFRMDYMGAAEFEFGALPSALRRIRENLPLPAPVEIKATRDGEPVSLWYVGPANALPAVTYWAQTCLAKDGGGYGFEMKEQPRLYDAYGPATTKYKRGSKVVEHTNYASRFVGWWCVDATAEWAVFRTLDHANNWVQALNNN